MSRTKDFYFTLFEDQSYDEDGVCAEQLDQLHMLQPVDPGQRAFASMIEHLTQTSELTLD